MSQWDPRAAGEQSRACANYHHLGSKAIKCCGGGTSAPVLHKPPAASSFGASGLRRREHGEVGRTFRGEEQREQGPSVQGRRWVRCGEVGKGEGAPGPTEPCIFPAPPPPEAAG